VDGDFINSGNTGDFIFQKSLFLSSNISIAVMLPEFTEWVGQNFEGRINEAVYVSSNDAILGESSNIFVIRAYAETYSMDKGFFYLWGDFDSSFLVYCHNTNAIAIQINLESGRVEELTNLECPTGN
jgi:hypothetical protein